MPAHAGLRLSLRCHQELLEADYPADAPLAGGPQCSLREWLECPSCHNADAQDKVPDHQGHIEEVMVQWKDLANGQQQSTGDT